MSAEPVVLRCHPQSRCNATRNVSVLARAAADDNLAVTFTLEADFEKLRIPAPQPPRRTDGLWRHTCFEVFVTADGEAYREFNFSPSGEWAAYAFTRYRDGGPLAVIAAPCVDARVDGSKLVLDALMPSGCLPAREAAARWRLGLTAIVEDAAGVLSYWALEHPPCRPDFHHPDGFVLQL